jgi:hypothetical protein
MEYSDRPSTYRIRVQGLLDPQWADWFDAFTLTYAGDETVLTGLVADQAALHSAINKLCDLGLTLLLVQRVDTAAADAKAA